MTQKTKKENQQGHTKTHAQGMPSPIPILKVRFLGILEASMFLQNTKKAKFQHT